MHLEISQIISQIIAFLIMLWVLKRYAWKPLLTVLEERRNKIQAEFQTIEEQKKANEDLANDYREKLKDIDNQARAKIQEGIEEGRKLSLEIQQEAHDTAKAIVLKTQTDMQKEVHKARLQLRNELVNMTLAASRKIIHASLDSEAENKLVADFVDQTEVS